MQFGFQKTAALLFAVAGLAACGGNDENPSPAVTQVSYQSLDPVKPLTIPATLRVPFVVPGMPAVVIVHGSGGIDSRGPSYAAELNKAGIATLEIDMWAPRGVTSPANRPRTVPETLPDAYGAFKYLASLPSRVPRRWPSSAPSSACDGRTEDLKARRGRLRAGRNPVQPSAQRASTSRLALRTSS